MSNKQQSEMFTQSELEALDPREPYGQTAEFTELETELLKVYAQMLRNSDEYCETSPTHKHIHPNTFDRCMLCGAENFNYHLND